MRYLIVIALIGLLLLIISNVFSTNEEEEQNMALPSDEQTDQSIAKEEEVSSDVSELEESYKKDLEQMLNKIKGVSDAEVMVNLDSTEINVYEKNLIKGVQTTDETDTNGGTRKVEDETEETDAVLIRQGDQEVPLLVETKKPEVRGVFIVAEGVDHATVEKWVIEAVARVLEAPTHKISVMPKN